MNVQAVRAHARVDSEPDTRASLGRQPRRDQPAQEATTRAASTSGGRRKPLSEAAIRRNLDAQLAAATGPYEVRGQRIEVSAAFRMKDGFNPLSIPAAITRIQKALPAKTFAALQAALGEVMVGKGTPAQIRRVTQALIDSDAWKKYDKMPVHGAIRQLMWDHCIGADCSGYVHHAFLAARSATSSRYGLGSPVQSGIQNPPAALFRTVPAKEARAGDVLILKPKDGVGHKVIVYDRHELPPSSTLHAIAEKALGSSRDATLHILQVDSSWGAGGKPDAGGVKRVTWMYDESRDRWGMLEHGSHGAVIVRSDATGPYDHELQGIYRPRDEN